MAGRIKIHIVDTGQDTTGEITLQTVIGNMGQMVAIIENIHNLKRFPMFSKVRFLGVEEDFYCNDEGQLISKDAKPFSYWERQRRKESEDNTMLHKVTITKPEERMLEEYWCMRAIKENPETKAKSVVKESECNQEPTLEEIALFLANSGGDFVSVEHNYRFADLPF